MVARVEIAALSWTASSKEHVGRSMQQAACEANLAQLSNSRKKAYRPLQFANQPRDASQQQCLGPGGYALRTSTGLLVAIGSARKRSRRRARGRGSICSAVTRRAAVDDDWTTSANSGNGVPRYSVLIVPVRGGTSNLTLKRFVGSIGGWADSVPRSRPAILLVHGGPGLNSRYLESFAAMLCEQEGRTCYIYDQLGCGMPNGEWLRQGTRDLQEVAQFLFRMLGESEVHLLGHGFGGSLIMEALLRQGVWAEQHKDEPAMSAQRLPQLLSVCLVGAPSSGLILKKGSWRLMRQAKQESGRARAPWAFWLKHYCGMRSPTCLSQAYGSGGASSPGDGPLGGWEPWDNAVLRGWQIPRTEVAQCYMQATAGAPFLSIRGANDFVTDECVDAWRGVQDAISASRVTAAATAKADGSTSRAVFAEEVVGGCGHAVQIEDPMAVRSICIRWLSNIEGF